MSRAPLLFTFSLALALACTPKSRLDTIPEDAPPTPRAEQPVDPDTTTAVVGRNVGSDFVRHGSASGPTCATTCAGAGATCSDDGCAARGFPDDTVVMYLPAGPGGLGAPEGFEMATTCEEPLRLDRLPTGTGAMCCCPGA